MVERGETFIDLHVKPVGIIANLEKPHALGLARELVGRLRKMRQRVFLERPLAEVLPGAEGGEVVDMARRCRLLVVFGGDGTILRVAREMYPHETPLLAVNLGKLGFLAAVRPAQLGEVLAVAVKGRFRITFHSTLEVDVLNRRQRQRGLVALNDAVVSRGPISRLTELELHVDGQFLNSYACDGMIISTPTGSTAYSLSAGGPIVVPEAGVHAITPICPHTLSNRSVIVGDRSVIEIRISNRPGELFLSLDGQRMIQLNPADRILARRGDYRVRMVSLPEGGFFELLRQKLRWQGRTFHAR
ncbi:MAG: NAD(+)/NADH kinase [Verrucomicrobiae bacterium]|nr:NAD(+)/NADH kinase [Verrucomicrobiae bacterium]